MADGPRAVATIVCFGDSNTHGMDPITTGRFPRDVRWPGVLAAELAGAAHVVEEGLIGRTTIWDDPYLEGRSGRPYLPDIRIAGVPENCDPATPAAVDACQPCAIRRFAHVSETGTASAPPVGCEIRIGGRS